MQLFLLRHADAESLAPTDSSRPLSLFGREQALRVGEYCRKKNLRPEVILASPLVRAQETAHIVAACLGVEVITSPFLASGMHPAVALESLKDYQHFPSMMMVGHEPDLSQFAGSLLGLRSSTAVEFGKATLVGLELSALVSRSAHLQFFLPENYL